MRISDWSSDVCSSDLHAADRAVDPGHAALVRPACPRADGHRCAVRGSSAVRPDNSGLRSGRSEESRKIHRSEEHTSELQSLMRLSYAVFCLKKKTINTTIINITIMTQHIQFINSLNT